MAPPSRLRADTQLSPPAPRDASRSQSDSSIASASPRAGSKKRRGDSNAQLQDESKVVAKRKPWSVLKKVRYVCVCIRCCMHYSIAWC